MICPCTVAKYFVFLFSQYNNSNNNDNNNSNNNNYYYYYKPCFTVDIILYVTKTVNRAQLQQCVP
jgi:hypothetical protein